MKHKNRIFAFIIVFISLKCVGQDSIRVDSEISIETIGQHNFVSIGSGNDCLNCLNGSIQDNPLFHLPIYTGIDYKLTLNHKYSLMTGLYLEERSLSGGNNTQTNLVFFPKILIEVKDTIHFLGKEVGVSIKGGDLWNEDIGDILRYYNIDYQGIIGKLNYNNWEASFISIGDLSRNIGLNIHQNYRFGLGYRKNSFYNLSTIAINELVTNPSGNIASSDINISNHTNYQLNSTIRILGQVDARINKGLPNSIALGVQMNYTDQNFNLSTSLRYYSSSYNDGHDGQIPSYIGPLGGYVGEQLYPLKNFYRPFSQWAAHVHNAPSDIFSIAFSSQWENRFYKKIGLFYDLDLNYQYDVSNRKSRIFPFYNTGFQIYFLSNFKVKFSLTNKHMELRDFYQTFMASKYPYLSLQVHVNLSKLKFKTMHL